MDCLDRVEKERIVIVASARREWMKMNVVKGIVGIRKGRGRRADGFVPS